MLLKIIISGLICFQLFSCAPVTQHSKSVSKHPNRLALQPLETLTTPDEKKDRINFLIEEIFIATDEKQKSFLSDIETLATADRFTWWVWSDYKTETDALLFNYSAYLGNVKLFKQLLKKYPTATTNGLSLHGLKPITLATISYNLEIINMILDTWGTSRLTAPKNEDNQPFSIAAYLGDVSLLQFLMQKGVDLKMDNGHSIVRAAAGGHLDTIKFLLKSGENWISEEKKQEALTVSLASPYLDVFHFLFEKLKPDTIPQTIIVTAAAHDHLDIIQRFTTEFKENSITEEIRQSALKKSIENGNFEITNYLLSQLKPANISAESFFCAIVSDDLHLVKKLLSYNSFDLATQAKHSCYGYYSDIDILGKTPLEISDAYNYTDISLFIRSLEHQQILAKQQQKAENKQRKRIELEKKREKLGAKIDENLPFIPSADSNTASVSIEENASLFQLMNEMFSSQQSDLSPYIGRLIAEGKGDSETFRIIATTKKNKDLALLLLASKYNHVELLKQLLKKYPDYALIKDQFTFDPPITLAINHGNPQIAELLIDTWGENQFSHFIFSLLGAVQIGDHELVGELLEAGAKWDHSVNGDPVVLAMTLGYREVAKVFMLYQGVTRLTDNQANEIFREAINDLNLDLAEAMVDSVTDTDQKALYYAVALGSEKMFAKFSSLPAIDLTKPAQVNYFNEVDTQGKTADEIALAFGHVELAKQIKVEIEDLAAEKRRRETERLAQKELDLQKKQEQQNREKILGRETAYLGPLRVKVLSRYLGFTGVKRTKKMNRWTPPSVGISTLSNLVSNNKSYPLTFSYWGDNHDLVLYVSQKRGLTKLSAMTNEVYLYSSDSEIFHFSFSKRGDTSFQGIAPTLIEKLNKALTKYSATIAQIKTNRDQQEIARTEKIKRDRIKKHDQTMLTIRKNLKNKEYIAAIDLIEEVEGRGIYQSDSLGYIKAKLLYKLGHYDQAKTTLKLYLVEHANSDSKYFAKAKTLLQKLESK